MSTQFAGQGTPLYLANTTALGAMLEPVWPRTTAIPLTSKTVCIAVNPALKTMITVRFTTAPGVATSILYSDDPTMSDSFIIDTLPISADTLAVWVQTEPLQGFLQISNTSGVILEVVTCQQVTATSWS